MIPLYLSLSPVNLEGTHTASTARVILTLNGVKSFDEMVAVISGDAQLSECNCVVAIRGKGDSLKHSTNTIETRPLMSQSRRLAP